MKDDGETNWGERVLSGVLGNLSWLKNMGNYLSEIDSNYFLQILLVTDKNNS